MSAQHVGIDKNWRIICLLKINQDFEPLLKIYLLFEKYQRLEKNFSIKKYFFFLIFFLNSWENFQMRP